MAINFGPGVSINGSEKAIYNAMKEMEVRVVGDVTNAWSDTVDFKKDGFRNTSCFATYVKSHRDFACRVTLEEDNKAQFSIPGENRVTEVRHGDIDKDGDIDIAIKLMDGAIFVFHNLTNK